VPNLSIDFLSIDFLLEGSLIGCHLPLLAVRELAGVGLWEWRGELEQSCVHAADCKQRVSLQAQEDTVRGGLSPWQFF
jgi:hypothetical protein